VFLISSFAQLENCLQKKSERRGREWKVLLSWPRTNHFGPFLKLSKGKLVNR